MMTAIHAFFEQGSVVYNHVFADWLYIPYLIRTLILLLIVWILVYACAQVCQYLLIPLFILFCYHVLFRAWNFLFVETLQEWIYIHYYSEDRPFLSRLYLRLCDDIKHNRMVLAHTRYSGLLYRGSIQKATSRLMVIAWVIASLWTVAFGLFNGLVTQEPASTAAEATAIPTATMPSATPEEFETAGSVITEDGAQFVNQPIDPTTWSAEDTIILALNTRGIGGSNVRNLPSVVYGTPIEVVKGDVQLTYLDDYSMDDNGVYWLKIRTPSGNEGYISASLLTRVR